MEERAEKAEATILEAHRLLWPHGGDLNGGLVTDLLLSQGTAACVARDLRERAEQAEARVAVLEQALALVVRHLDGLQHSEDCSRTSECDEAADAGEECSYCALPGCPSCECGIGDLQKAETAARLLLEAK